MSETHTGDEERIVAIPARHPGPTGTDGTADGGTGAG